MYSLHRFASTAKISVCVPAYNASKFVCETLESICQQTFSDIELLVSVDSSRDTTLLDCQRFARRNFRLPIKIFEQGQRLGWVDNIKFLIAQSKSPYFCVIGHDDLLVPTYLEELYNCLENNPSAVQAYSDIETFGELQRFLLVQSSLRGPLFQRVTEFLRNHYKAVSFRGLTRRELLGNNLVLGHNQFEDFSIDTLGMLQTLLCGEMLRVPKALYKKRYHKESTHKAWQNWSKERAIAAWLEHCLDCLHLLNDVRFDKKQLEELHLGLEQRLLQDDLHLWRPELFRELSDRERHYLWTMMQREIADTRADRDMAYRDLADSEQTYKEQVHG